MNFRHCPGTRESVGTDLGRFGMLQEKMVQQTFISHECYLGVQLRGSGTLFLVVTKGRMQVEVLLLHMLPRLTGQGKRYCSQALALKALLGNDSHSHHTSFIKGSQAHS